MKSSIISPAIALLLVTACGSGKSDPRSNPQMEQAFMCAKSAGITGQVTIERIWAGGVETIAIVPANGISNAQASAANLCIAGV